MLKKIRIGIIAEYNPFHNGHIFQINWIKKKWPNSTIIVILSGKYVQRGELAIADFESRKNIAMNFGVDEVYELNFKYATQAAHIFAFGALMEANKQKIDILVFGSESNNIDDFYLVANAIYSNETKYNLLLKKELKKGISFPKANQIALQKIINKSFIMPNDILGLEYVKTIVKEKLNIKAVCLKRNVGFHSYEIDNNITSATNIRKMILENNYDYKKYTPMRFKYKPDIIENYYYKFQDIVINSSADELRCIHLISEGMENLFKKNIYAKTYDEFVSLCNSKRYTSSRIKRTMLYVLLQIKKNEIN